MSFGAGVSDRWKRWSCDDWSYQLVGFLFEYDDAADDEPVTSLVVTPEALKAVTMDSEASESEVRDAFVEAVRRRLRTERKSLCADARSTGDWTPRAVHERPCFVSHLALACLAASECNAELVDEAGFQGRLNALAGDHVSNHNPSCLPDLWKALATWLENCRGRELPMRSLVVPDPGGLTRIGHTIKLAFPNRRDQELLVQILDQNGLLGFSPPLQATMRAVGAQRRRFTERFRSELADFESRVAQGEPGVGRLPLWQAVREASLRGAVASRRVRPRFHLIAGADDGALWLLIVLRGSCDPPPRGYRIRDLPAEEYGGWGQYIVADGAPSDGEGADEAVSALFAGALDLVPLARFVDQGLLTFGSRGGGIYELETNPPTGGEVVLLVRDEHRERVEKAISVAGENAGVVRPAAWDGWVQIGPINASKSLWSGTGLRDRIWCLQDSIPMGRMRLRGRISVGGSILGRAAVLPEVVAEGAAGVSAHLDDGTVLELESIDDCTFRLPDRDLEGAVVFESHGEGTGDVLERRPFGFTLRGGSHLYRTLSDPAAWRVEGAASDVVPLESTGANPEAFAVASPDAELADGADAAQVFLGPAIGQLSSDPDCGFDWVVHLIDGSWRLQFVGDVAKPAVPHGRVASKSNARFWRKVFSQRVRSFDGDVSSIAEGYRRLAREQVEVTDSSWPALEVERSESIATAAAHQGCNVLEDILSALNCQRTGIAEGELLDIVTRVFELERREPSPWDLLRLWQEAGRLLAVSPIRWRGRRYLATPPSLVLRPAQGGVAARLWGLTAEGFRSRAREAAEDCGVRVVERRSVSAYLSPTIDFIADEPEAIAHIVRLLELPSARWVRAPRTLARGSPLEVVAKAIPPPRYYALKGSWDPASGCFSHGGAIAGSSLERWARTDAPEVLVQRNQQGEAEWWTYSRNWALLAHYQHSSLDLFAPERERVMRRAAEFPVHLPLELARALCALSPELPGPVQRRNGSWTYDYPLPSVRATSLVTLALKGR